MQQIFPNLTQGINWARSFLKTFGETINTDSWQGVKDMPEVKKMFEVDNVYFRACMPQGKIALQEQVRPDLPWAEDHFQERVAGQPLNPGIQYKNWPYYRDTAFNDNKFRVDGKFTHTYMERYWAKEAGNQDRYMKAVHGEPLEKSFAGMEIGKVNMGIRYEYGDLNDVIGLLLRDPTTRQAYLPVWFPEDTGVNHGGRVPCSIGYHFMRKGEDLNMHYMIRACDYIRHFRNDIYLTVRLAQWVLGQLKEKGDNWDSVQLGVFTMDIIHFHVFDKEKNLV